MKKERRKFGPVFNTKVVLEAIKEASTMQELASKYILHPTQITAWKWEFLEKADAVFSSEKPTSNASLSAHCLKHWPDLCLINPPIKSLLSTSHQPTTVNAKTCASNGQFKLYSR